jgi:hypothetical protein
MLIGLKGYINHKIDLYGNVSVSESVSVRKIPKDSQSICEGKETILTSIWFYQRATKISAI